MKEIRIKIVGNKNEIGDIVYIAEKFLYIKAFYTYLEYLEKNELLWKIIKSKRIRNIWNKIIKKKEESFSLEKEDIDDLRGEISFSLFFIDDYLIEFEYIQIRFPHFLIGKIDFNFLKELTPIIKVKELREGSLEIILATATAICGLLLLSSIFAFIKTENRGRLKKIKVDLFRCSIDIQYDD